VNCAYCEGRWLKSWAFSNVVWLELFPSGFIALHSNVDMVVFINQVRLKAWALYRE
jgi:hypothetical protein